MRFIISTGVGLLLSSPAFAGFAAPASPGRSPEAPRAQSQVDASEQARIAVEDAVPGAEERLKRTSAALRGDTWEYRVVKSGAGMQEWLRMLGNAGWELVSVVAVPDQPELTRAFLKRRVVKKAAPTVASHTRRVRRHRTRKPVVEVREAPERPHTRSTSRSASRQP